MGLITHILQQNATIITTQTDGYGDQVPIIGETILCRFRYITELDRRGHAEMVDTTNDAIIWFESTAPVLEGTIVLVDESYWRITRLVKARRLSGSSIEFIKTFVKKHELAGDFS